MLIAVQKGDFKSVRTVDPRIAPALEAICHQAIATKPEDRYSSPRALADNVGGELTPTSQSWLSPRISVAASRDG